MGGCKPRRANLPRARARRTTADRAPPGSGPELWPMTFRLVAGHDRFHLRPSSPHPRRRFAAEPGSTEMDVQHEVPWRMPAGHGSLRWPAAGLGLLTVAVQEAQAVPTRPGDGSAGPSIIAAAFIEGIAVWGVFEGILAVSSASAAAGAALSGPRRGPGRDRGAAQDRPHRAADLVDRQAAFFGGTFAVGLANARGLRHVDPRDHHPPGEGGRRSCRQTRPLLVRSAWLAEGALCTGDRLGRGRALAAARPAMRICRPQAHVLRRFMPLTVVGNGAIGLAVVILLFG